jgi:hypothetical protein
MPALPGGIVVISTWASVYQGTSEVVKALHSPDTSGAIITGGYMRRSLTLVASTLYFGDSSGFIRLSGRDPFFQLTDGVPTARER